MPLLGHAGPGGSYARGMQPVDLLLKGICQFAFSKVCRVIELENVVDGI